LDPIGSPGFVESVVSFHEFRRIEPELPLFCGIGNVVELLDADTIGVNALAAGVASELGISLLLTTEVSDKCRGCVKELATAAKMMFLSKKRGSVPMDLGIDLLSLKDRRFLEEAHEPSCEMGASELLTCPARQVSMDLKGCFKIMIDRKVGKIVAIHYPMHTRDKPDFFVNGETAQEIYRTLIASNLIENLDHSAYVGYELGKAEIALRTGKSYVQDSTLFT
jgi:dihydropteroate synthase-like protein